MRDHNSTGPHATALTRNSFQLFNLFYQIGVVVGRSPLGIVPYCGVSLAVLGLGLSLAFWFLLDRFKFSGIYLQLPAMTLAGVLSGVAYVSTFFHLHNDKAFGRVDRELCITLVTFAITFGIASAGLLVVILLKDIIPNA